MVDERTPAEIASNYPPRKSTMVRTCTVPIIGEPDEWLFDEVTAELLDFLNSPGLTREELFTTFRDTAGAFVAPSLYNTGKGRFFRGPNAKAAKRLVVARPQSWLDVLRVRDIGPDSYYDMFNMMAVRWVHRFGESLAVFVAADGSPLDGVNLTIHSGPGIASPQSVTVRHGVGFDATTGDVYAFPSIGEYVVADATASIRVNVPVATAVTRVGLGSANALRVFHDPEIVTLTVHPAKATYPAKHAQQHGDVRQERDPVRLVRQVRVREAGGPGIGPGADGGHRSRREQHRRARTFPRALRGRRSLRPGHHRDHGA